MFQILNSNESSKNKISNNDLLVKAIATAQFQTPITNASWINGRIVNYSSVDVSIAVALEDGLITPIIKNADKKGYNAENLIVLSRS